MQDHSNIFAISDWEQWPRIHNCSCQATQHPLWKNCLSCGQILCEAHGPGPCCSYCGANIFQNEDSMISKRKAKRMESLQQQTINHQKTIITTDENTKDDDPQPRWIPQPTQKVFLDMLNIKYD